MKKTLIYLTMIILLPLTTALTTQVDCPATVQVEEIFTCEVTTSEGLGQYDIKFDITSGSSSVAQLQHDNEEWKSAYFYRQETIDGQETKEYKLQIIEAGAYDATLKLRQDNKIDTTSFHIEATTLPKHIEDSEKENLQPEEEETFDTTLEQKKEILNEQDSNLNEQESVKAQEEISTISLNSQTPTASDENEGVLVYESKNSTILTYLPIAFIILIILLVIFHYWEKL